MASRLPGLTPAPPIRAATLDDAAQLAALLDALGYPCSAEDAAERIRRVQDDPDQQLLVAELHGSLQGLLCLDVMYYLPLGARTARILALSVSPEARRMGVGRSLLREAEARAREAGALRIELTTADHRTEAHAFYRACGYEDSALRFLKRLGSA